MICADALFDGHHGPDGADRGNLLIGPLSRRLSRKIYAAAIISGELGVRLPALAIAINQVGFQRYVFARLQTGCPDDRDLIRQHPVGRDRQILRAQPEKRCTARDDKFRDSAAPASVSVSLRRARFNKGASVLERFIRQG
jgi:hypothetical protein